jgi:hypothetical protein
MAVSPTSKLTVSPDALTNLLERESVVLDLKSEQYFGLNESATRMWSALIEAGTIDGAFQKLIAEYAIEPAILRQDLDVLVEKLVERHLIHVDAN